MKNKSAIQSLKAYLATFSGLIPCVIIAHNDTLAHVPTLAGRSSSCTITVKLTAKRGAYKRGEIIESDALHVIPRNAVYRSSGQYRFRSYAWKF